MIKNIILFSLLIFMGCSSIVNKPEIKLPKNKKYAISSFWNYTQTPMAGLSASSVVEGVLSQNNINLYSLIGGEEEIENIKTKENFIAQKKGEARRSGASYLITGDVQEWRYKSGIDAEPVVSYTVKIIDLDSDKIVFNAIGAKSGWAHKSIGVLAQEIAQEILPKFVN
jgi:TolB-like protein